MSSDREILWQLVLDFSKKFAPEKGESCLSHGDRVSLEDAYKKLGLPDPVPVKEALKIKEKDPTTDSVKESERILELKNALREIGTMHNPEKKGSHNNILWGVLKKVGILPKGQ